MPNLPTLAMIAYVTIIVGPKNTFKKVEMQFFEH
jgi:hypothetical protein